MLGVTSQCVLVFQIFDIVFIQKHLAMFMDSHMDILELTLQ